MQQSRKLQEVRKLCAQYGVAGFMQPSSDEFLNEYVPACNRRLEWLTGFTGSAGMAVVLAEKAAFFTDGRYTLQAPMELDTSLFSIHNSAEEKPEDWILAHLQNDVLGYDPRLHTQDAIQKMQTALSAKGVVLLACDNPVDRLWEGRPSLPDTNVQVHALEHCGVSASQKREQIAKELVKLKVDGAFITTPESVNWLLNIRARDIEFTPVALAAAYIRADGSVQLFIRPERCDNEVRAHLGNEVELCGPGRLAEQFMRLRGKRVLCDTRAVPLSYVQQLERSGATVVDGRDPCLLPKALKNPQELAGIFRAHERDGVAVVKLLHWLDTALRTGAVKESEVDKKLLAFRAEDPSFVSPSFASITGSGANGAIVHYRVTAQTDRVLRGAELFLLDSGGQYPDGTTDITRTIPVGAPTPEHKDRFTRVLKGHIAIATVLFPEGTTGAQLDVLARRSLWEAGLDYDHGTGHGVGCFLSVHEGPQGISKRSQEKLLPGMVVSNEPGYYKSGAYGIRIENLVVVVEKIESEGKRYLGFDTLTCVPIDTRLVNPGMLSADEKAWLNAYHAWVWHELAGQLDDDTRRWLELRCTPVE